MSNRRSMRIPTPNGTPIGPSVSLFTISDRLYGFDDILTSQLLRLSGATIFHVRGDRRVTVADLTRVARTIRMKRGPDGEALADALLGGPDSS